LAFSDDGQFFGTLLPGLLKVGIKNCFFVSVQATGRNDERFDAFAFEIQHAILHILNSLVLLARLPLCVVSFRERMMQENLSFWLLNRDWFYNFLFRSFFFFGGRSFSIFVFFSIRGPFCF